MSRIPEPTAQALSNRRAPALLITLLLTACSQGAAATANEDDIEFNFSADPSVEIVCITYIGGMTGINPAYSLFGDGRLEFRKENVDGEVLETFDTRLTFNQMVELINIAATSNLAEATTEEVEASLKALRSDGLAPQLEDGADAVFEISLTSYSRAGLDPGPVDNKIVMHSPAYLSRFYKVEEFVGFASIMKLIRNYSPRLTE